MLTVSTVPNDASGRQALIIGDDTNGNQTYPRNKREFCQPLRMHCVLLLLRSLLILAHIYGTIV